MKDEHKEAKRIKQEVQHIFDSGANEIRMTELINRIVSDKNERMEELITTLTTIRYNKYLYKHK